MSDQPTNKPPVSLVVSGEAIDQGLLPARKTHTLLLLAAFVVLVAGMKSAQPVLVPFLLALFISVIIAQPMFWMRKFKIPTGVSILIAIVVAAAAMFALVVVVGSSVRDFTENIETYTVQLSSTRYQLTEWLKVRWHIELSSAVQKEWFDAGAAMRMTGRLVGSLGGLLSNAFFIFLLVIFLLIEASNTPAKLVAMFGNRSSEETFLQRTVWNVREYMVRKSVMSLSTGALVTAWLSVLQVKYPLMWGLIAFLLNFVPNIGSIIAAIPPILLALLQFGPMQAVWTAAGLMVINIGISNFIEPRYMGHGLGLAPLVVFLSLIFWGWVLGPVGMFLSVPLTMIAKIIFEGSPQTRWIAILLGPKPPTIPVASPQPTTDPAVTEASARTENP